MKITGVRISHIFPESDGLPLYLVAVDQLHCFHNHKRPLAFSELDGNLIPQVDQGETTVEPILSNLDYMILAPSTVMSLCTTILSSTVWRLVRKSAHILTASTPSLEAVFAHVALGSNACHHEGNRGPQFYRTI